jgi:hypothetical protein
MTNYEKYMVRIATSIFVDFANTPERYRTRTIKRKLWWAKRIFKTLGITRT